MKKTIALLVITSLLTACSALDWIKPFLPNSGSGISAEAQLGDRNASLGDHEETKQEIDVEDVKGDVTIKSESTKIKQESDVRVEQAKDVRVTNISFWLIVLLILGWCLPTPSTMIRGIRNAWQGWMERRALGSGSGSIRRRSTRGPGIREESLYCTNCGSDIPTGSSCDCCSNNIRS